VKNNNQFFVKEYCDVDFHCGMLAFHGARPEPPRRACGVSAFPHIP